MRIPKPLLCYTCKMEAWREEHRDEGNYCMIIINVMR